MFILLSLYLLFITINCDVVEVEDQRAVLPYNCNEPPLPGVCNGKYTRWFYDYYTKQCKTFIYGGCGGNDNNFQSRAECESCCLIAPYYCAYQSSNIPSPNNQTNNHPADNYPPGPPNYPPGPPNYPPGPPNYPPGPPNYPAGPPTIPSAEHHPPTVNYYPPGAHPTDYPYPKPSPPNQPPLGNYPVQPHPPTKPPIHYPPNTTPPKCSIENEFCGGFGNIQCCNGLQCNESQECCDRGGHCVRNCSSVLGQCGRGLPCCQGFQCISDPLDRFGTCHPVCSAELGICGTLLGHTCCDGLTCELSDQCCDFPGVCRRCQDDLETCGGSSGLKCCKGLECKQSSPDRPGYCLANCSAQGEVCGGIVGFQCCGSLRCNAPIDKPDAHGICTRCGARHETCGGIEGLRCCDGLKCVKRSDYPDYPGSCQYK